jgi:hypothetical protein
MMIMLRRIVTLRFTYLGNLRTIELSALDFCRSLIGLAFGVVGNREEYGIIRVIEIADRIPLQTDGLANFEAQPSTSKPSTSTNIARAS